MTPAKAIAMAHLWVMDMEPTAKEQQFSFFHMVRALLDHIELQDKDIQGLTDKCQQLLRENRELKDALRRSKDTC